MIPGIVRTEDRETNDPAVRQRPPGTSGGTTLSVGWPARRALVGVLLIVMVGSVFLPALDIFLIGDDFEWLDAAFQIPARPLSSFELINMMWRPVVKWTFLLDYLVFGRWTVGYAATNLAIHVLNVWLLYVFLTRLQSSMALAAAGAAAFALSPLHSGAVLWASSRGDTLLLASWLGSLLALIAWQHNGRRLGAAVFVVFALVGAGAKESWVVFPFISALFLIFVLRQPLLVAIKRTGWLWFALLLYLGVFVVLRAVSGASTAAYYADFSPLPALIKVARLVLSFCGLGGLGLSDGLAVVIAFLVAGLAVAVAVRQGNRCAQWTIVWTAAALALAAPFSDLALRHNYLCLAGFWMTFTLLVEGGLAARAAPESRRWKVLSALFAASVVAVLVIEGLALQIEIRDYRRYGKPHRHLADMIAPIAPQIPHDRPLLFIDHGRRRAVEEAAASVAGVEKSFFVRRDAIWQLVFLPPLLNFVGDPFDARLVPVTRDDVDGVVTDRTTVLVFTDGGFRLLDRWPAGLAEVVTVTCQLPAGARLYRFEPNRRLPK